MRFGMHVSIEGSPDEAPLRAAELGCECFQIFAGPPRNWRRKAPSPPQAERFKLLVSEHGLRPVAVHAGYLVHLVSEKPRVAEASASLFRAEFAAAEALGADYYVVHPGTVGDRERAAVLRRFVRAVASAMAGHGEGGPALLLENTASLRAGLCARFEHLGELLKLLREQVGRRVRFGVCFDTAHATAAGYDLATEEGAARTLRSLYRAVGRSRVRLVHANDSRSPAGSSRDLHEHIGRGHVGSRGFAAIFSDRTMRRLPFILETPVDSAGDDKRNLAAIRRIAKKAEKNRG